MDRILAAAGDPAGIFVLQNPHLTPHVPPHYAERVPIKVIAKPNELYYPPDDEVRQKERAVADTVIPELTSELIAFAYEVGAEEIWIVLEGQTLIRVAHRLLATSDFPLRVQVMDPPGWWLRAHNVDPETSTEAVGQFNDVLRGARSCAATSWAMCAAYHREFGVRAVPVVPAVDPALALPPAEAPQPRSIRIGFAGQPYAWEEFNALVRAMAKLRWNTWWSAVELHVFADRLPPVESGQEVIVKRPWLPQAQLISELAQLDLLYCPYWFSEEYREEANLCFPSKLSTYLATGRPVLLHSRADSSPGRFLRAGSAAFFCFRTESGAMHDLIEQAVGHSDRYAEIAHNGRALFDQYLSMPQLRKTFQEFLL
ncbi:hypothetical protein [Methylobacterium nodulans]|uniref:hypothetical protein n=1 Tax=Methylobacterium nodulans TaxID=114616 RepID=UPI0012EEBDA7|nr:hypothetical protein [Methylobacterium nodulans]